MKEQAFVYLLLEREFRRPGAPHVFKVGRSVVLADRCEQYPKGSLLLNATTVAGIGKDAEDALKAAFKAMFVWRRDLGIEYYQVLGAPSLEHAGRRALACFFNIAHAYLHVPELIEEAGEPAGPEAAEADDAGDDTVGDDTAGEDTAGEDTASSPATDEPAPVSEVAVPEEPCSNLDQLLHEHVTRLAEARPGAAITVAEVFASFQASVKEAGHARYADVSCGRVLRGLRAMHKVHAHQGQLGITLPGVRATAAAPCDEADHRGEVHRFLTMEDRERGCTIALVPGRVTLLEDFRARFQAAMGRPLPRARVDRAALRAAGYHMNPDGRRVNACKHCRQVAAVGCCARYSAAARTKKDVIYNMAISDCVA